MLAFLSMLVLTCIEVAARYQELAQIKDALKRATRSSVQAFDYAAVAQNGQRVREASAARVTGCAAWRHTAPEPRLHGFTTNAAGVEDAGNAEPGAAGSWTFLPQGGTCTSERPPAGHFTTPAVCATLRPRMTGLLGWGIWSPQIDAADTLDHVGN